MNRRDDAFMFGIGITPANLSILRLVAMRKGCRAGFFQHDSLNLIPMRKYC
jgi:lysine/ornithine N-monooxygenase